MEPRSNHIPLTYDTAVSFLAGRARRNVPCIRKTYVARRDPDRIAVHYGDQGNGDADVVTFLPSGTLVVDAAGHRQRTTKTRINAVLKPLGCRICQVRGTWLLHTPSGSVLPFEDGMVVHPLTVTRAVRWTTL